MKYFTSVVLLTLIPLLMQAQATKNDLTGEYYLQGVMETASGFKLNPDSTFDFFFSYGALDRYGKGTWTVNDKKIIFNSKPKPARDFTMRTSKAATGKATTVKMVDINPALAAYIDCSVKSNGTSLVEPINRNGEISFPLTSVDTILLQLQFCPEKISVFPVADKKHTYFEFTFEPWIFEYFFENFSLSIEKDELKGMHPMLTGNEYHFVKN